jgi:hypothetical protein
MERFFALEFLLRETINRFAPETTEKFLINKQKTHAPG